MNGLSARRRGAILIAMDINKHARFLPHDAGDGRLAPTVADPDGSVPELRCDR
jgi:hypothetical protein